MKNLFSILLLLIGFTSFAQQKFHAGVHFGALGSQVSGDQAAGFNKPGITIGLFDLVQLKNDKTFQFELNYIQKGSRIWPDAKNGQYNSYYLKINYVEVPFTWTFPISGFQLETGIALSKSISVKEGNQFGDFPSLVDMNFAEAGFLIGFQKSINDKLMYKVRYGNSLTPLRDHHGGGKTLFNWGQYHSLVEAKIYYFFKTY